ncbi:MAG TPA: DUF916 domain-containing protein [Actinomycetota bacterium]|nr:DUF916 domain-containing protein [Actinomycetota bacterium]
MIRKSLVPAAAALLIPVLLAAPALGRQPGVEFAASPGPGSQTAPRGGYFLIDAEPGEEIRQSVTLLNESARRLRLALAGVDATTGQLGGISYALPLNPVQRTGEWIALDSTDVSLAPGASKTVGFTVTVPSDADAGEHIAGLTVWEPAEEREQTRDGDVSVVIRTRRVLAIQVNLPGPKAPELVVTGVRPTARPDGLYLEVQIENRGTAMTTAEGTLDLEQDGFVRDFSVDTFVPGTSIGYPIKWADEPEEGSYRAAVEIEYDGRVAEWAGAFTVGEQLVAELEDRGVEVPSEFPLLPVAVAAAAAVAAVATVLRLRGRSPAAAGPPQRTNAGVEAGADSRRHAPRARSMGSPPPPPPPPPDRAR